MINVSHSDSIMELLDKNVCLELNALGNSEKTFFIETLLVWIHHCRMLEGERETFKHCIIIEEAHNILSASTKETVVDVLMREIRELGEAIVLVDQHPSLMSIPAIGNTYCTIALNAKHNKDLTCLGEIMQVPRDDRTFFSQLPMGHAVIKLQSRYILPFQVRFPKVPLDKGSITDTDLMQMYPSDSTDSAAGSPGLPEPELTDPIPDRHEKQAEPHQTGLSVLEERLLQDIREHPLDGVVKRYTRLGVSRRRGNHAKESLMAKNLILTVDVPTKTGKSVLLDLTPHVKETLRQKGIEVPTQRDGGLIHTYWKEELRRMLAEHGWTVTLERPIGNGEAVDLEAVKGDCRVALEVETGTRGCDNILRLLDQRFEWIVTFSVDPETEERTKRALMNKRVSVNHLLFAAPTDYDQKVGLLDRHATKN